MMQFIFQNIACDSVAPRVRYADLICNDVYYVYNITLGNALFDIHMGIKLILWCLTKLFQ